MMRRGNTLLEVEDLWISWQSSRENDYVLPYKWYRVKCADMHNPFRHNGLPYFVMESEDEDISVQAEGVGKDRRWSIIRSKENPNKASVAEHNREFSRILKELSAAEEEYFDDKAITKATLKGRHS